MLITKPEERVAETNTESNEMTADSSKMAKLYFMMSSTLYTDKLMSILRELCSNARDSHNEAGKLDIPFALIAPTMETPTLTVADVGVGMTYEFAKKTILMFLGSTKDEDVYDEAGNLVKRADDNIGGWGIGAKAPRAYTSNYQIIMRKDGVETAVQVFDKNGMPNEVEMYTCETEKPNGIDFLLPIQPKDVEVWRNKIKDYISFTNYNVEAFMGDGEVLRPPKPYGTVDHGDFSAEFVGSLEQGKVNAASTVRPYVVYGGMRYEIPSQMMLEETLEKIRNCTARGLELRIRVDKPNALKFGLSREHLEVEDGTVKFVNSAVCKVYEEMQKVMREENIATFTEKEVSSWALIEQLSARIAEEVKEGVRNLYGKYCRKLSTRVRWTPEDLKQETYRRRGYELRYHSGITFGLPFDEEDGDVRPRVAVLYSDKRPTQDDWLQGARRAASSIYLQCPDQSKDVEAVKAWAEGLIHYKGVVFEYVYVQSTRGVRVGSGNIGATFAVCSESGTRKQIGPGTTYVMVPDIRYADMLRDRDDKFFFVPTKAFKKRQDLPSYVVSVEEYMQQETVAETLEHRYKGRNLTGEHLTVLRSALERIPEAVAKFPEDLKKECQQLRKELAGVANDVHCKLQWIKSAEENGYLDLLPIYHDYDVDGVLKKSNDILYLLEKHKDVLELVDFGNLKRLIDKGNDAAKRMSIVLNLEQFYE